MIIDAGHVGWHVLLRAAGTALVLWFGALLALPFASEASRNVTLFAISEADALRAIASADVDILGGSRSVLKKRGRTPGFASRLYASGRVVILAGNSGGCGIARQR